MAIKKRIDKKRIELTEDAVAWLEGRECGFFQFKNVADLIPLWEKYGDPRVPTWDLGRSLKPRAVNR